MRYYPGAGLLHLSLVEIDLIVSMSLVVGLDPLPIRRA